MIGKYSNIAVEVSGEDRQRIFEMIVAEAIAAKIEPPRSLLEIQFDDLPDNIAEFIISAQTEIEFLDANIPLIPTVTTVPQLRVAVERLARENRQIIMALVRLIRSS